MVTVRFNVKVPIYTQKTDPVFVSGNLPQFGNWDAGKIKLEKIGELLYGTTFVFDPGTALEFKFTRGSWDTVEKGKNGEELSNRQITVDKSTELAFIVEQWGDKVKIERKHTLTGNIQTIENFYAKKLNNRRRIILYLPPSYEKEPQRRYPVLYMHDGQNIFDAATSFIGAEWGVDETVEKLIAENKLKEIIVVGIDNNADRMKEYTPYVEEERGGGGGDAYMDFMINDLKPYIDQHYRTMPDRKHTAIMGSSLGGLISLYIAWKHPEIFSMSGVISPALYWGHSKIFDEINKTEKKDVKIYLDMGTNEGTTTGVLKKFNEAIDDVRKMKETLIKKGFVLGKDFDYFEDEGAVHNESAWAKRVHKPLLFFFPK